MPIVKLFLGEQDGQILETNITPEILWVPDYHGQAVLKLVAEGKVSITPQEQEDLLNLPYVLRNKKKGSDGEQVYVYEYCEDLAVHESDSPQ